MNEADIVVAIECCRDCKQHQWNTRHDQARYQHFFDEFQREAKAHVGSATFALNNIPTRFLEAESFKAMNLTDAASDGFQRIRPRIGAFQIYLQSYCIYSKLSTGLWPHIPSVVRKLQKAVEALQEGKDMAQFAVEERKRGNSVIRSSPSPLRNRSNSKSKNITPVRSSFKSPKPFKNASPSTKPPRGGPPMIQNNIAIIHGYQGKPSNEDVTSSLKTKSSQKSLEKKEPLAKTILDTKEKPLERRQSNEDKEEALDEENNDEKNTAEVIETYPESFEKEQKKESLPMLDDNTSQLQPKEAPSPHQVEASESSKIVSQPQQIVDEPRPKSPQQLNNDEQPQEISQAPVESEIADKNIEEGLVSAPEDQFEKGEVQLPSQESAIEKKSSDVKLVEEKRGEEEAVERKSSEAKTIEKKATEEEEQKKEEESYQEDYTFQNEEKTEEAVGEGTDEAKEEIEAEKRDTLEQLPSQKPSKMSINDYKREESSERYEESFDQSESMNESTVAQRLAVATIDRAKESIKNQMEVQTEASNSKVGTAEKMKNFESGPLTASKIEEEAGQGEGQKE